MVNAEKHKGIQAKYGMIPVEDHEFMNKWCAKIIDDTNENPQITLDGLDNLTDELTNYYNNLSKSNVGSVIKIGGCQRILEVYEHVYVLKYCIQYNYHMLRIDGRTIKAILRKCDRVLNEYRNIQALQNKNIDRKGYGGLYSLMPFDLDAKDYSKEQYESIIRLKEPIFIGE